MRYKVNVTFQGTAALEVEADTVDDARRQAAALTPADLARSGHTDILTFRVAAREATAAAAIRGEQHGPDDESGSPKNRPSGWYRPG